MKITEVIVSAGRVISHPTESYANLRPQVTVKATLDDSDSFEDVTKDLQAKAEKLVEDHKTNLVESILRLERMSREEQELSDLEHRIRAAQNRVEQIRSGRFQLAASNGDDSPERWDDK